MKFKTRILQFGNNTGIEVPEKMLEQLGGGRRPLVIVTVNGYTYRSAVGKMADKFLISLSAEHRNNAGVKGNETHEVTVELDEAPRTVEVPHDLQKALDQNKPAKIAFEKLAPSKKKAAVLLITTAKSPDTRQKRIDKFLEALSQGL